MLLRCCLIYIIIIILRLILHLVYFCPCPGLGLLLSYLYDLFFIFSFIFIVINATSLEQIYLLFVHFLEHLLLFLDDDVDEGRQKFSNGKSSASGCGLDFVWVFANFSLASLIKKSVYLYIKCLLNKRHVK